MEKVITVDARGAGEGKTTTGIYPKIQRLRAFNENILLVVPSQRLQDQYESAFKGSNFIKLNSTTDEGVCNAAIRMMINLEDITLCITHEAFLRLKLDYNLKNKWNLIIDEVINPYRFISWESRNNSIDWSHLINLPKDTLLDDEVPFLEVDVNEDQDDSWTEQIRDIQNLKNREWHTYTSTKSYKALQSNTAARADFIQMLDISKVSGWKTVHIAAAAFDVTFMRYWLDHNKRDWQIDAGCEFKMKKDLKIRVHCPESGNGNDDFRWSIYKQITPTYSQYYKKYTDYVINHCMTNNIDKILRIKNKSVNKFVMPAHIKEHLLDHNVHGMNDCIDYTAVSLESSLNFSDEIVRGLYQLFGISSKQIDLAHGAYLFYQVLMRTSLRLRDNQRYVDVFLLDTKIAIELAGLVPIDPGTNNKQGNFYSIDLGFIPPKRGRKKKEQALTRAERAAKHRAKKKALLKDKNLTRGLKE